MPDLIQQAQELTESVRGLTISAATLRHTIQEQQRHRLTEREARIMRYFWNARLQRERERLPVQVVLFFESEQEAAGAANHVQERTVNNIASLMAKRYIDLIEESGELELTRDGLKWLMHEYPPTIRWWQKLLERTPGAAQIIYAAIGLVSGAWGVIELVQWVIARVTAQE